MAVPRQDFHLSVQWDPQVSWKARTNPERQGLFCKGAWPLQMMAALCALALTFSGVPGFSNLLSPHCGHCSHVRSDFGALLKQFLFFMQYLRQLAEV